VVVPQQQVPQQSGALLQLSLVLLLRMLPLRWRKLP
jgi:hypothetical protein